ncbi:MAG: polysaccharide lyase beta-sandwich domain-containing protein [Prolixibacteraceae bacterium]|jgi:hypothetical protein|nr:polysaccharide lyase beta-sandwich domain-containing protein [Prolixibacteraceae bacterium]
MKQFYLMVLLLTLSLVSHNGYTQTKQKDLQNLRAYFSNHSYRGYELKKATDLATCLSTLQDNGHFSDFSTLENDIISNQKYYNQYSTAQKKVSSLTKPAMLRVWRIAEAIKKKRITNQEIQDVLPKLYKAILFYGDIEKKRGSISAGRFHESCFSIPTSAVNSYFCLYDLMEASEQGTNSDVTLAQVNTMLKDLSFQCWTQPFRNDATDNNVVSVERFRNHVWWVGGNALAYRSLLPTAVAMNSIPMLDVLSTVSQNALSSVAQNTKDQDFWSEGITADGAGWGHGQQSIVWGYPIDGSIAALNILEYFQGTAWEQGLTASNKEALFNYLRGSSWYYYKGFLPLGLGRAGMEYSNTVAQTIKSKNLVKKLLSKWTNFFTAEELAELNDFQSTAANNIIDMPSRQDGEYKGTRWFYNNDDLIKKNDQSYIFINTASVRADGTESAPDQADAFNFFTDLGMTLFLKDGNEHYRSLGAWNLSSLPGTTTRQNVDPMVPVTNWRGYCSKKNFAGGATHGGSNAVAGYELQIMDASKKLDGISYDPNDPNPFIYGVRAFKSYFIFGDYMLALGSNIDNMNTSKEGEIWTTIEQTAWEGQHQIWEDNHPIQTSSTSQNYSFNTNNTHLFGAAQTGKFAYAVLPQWTTGEVVLTTANKATNWAALNYKNRKRTDMESHTDLFHMYINHGRNVTDGTYAYIVYSGNQTADQAFTNSPIQVLDNSLEIQAAENPTDKIMGIVFHKTSKKLNTGTLTITTDHPAVLLLEEKDGNIVVTANDPTMSSSLTSINLTLDGTLWDHTFSNESVQLNLSQGHHAGKPVTTVISSGSTASDATSVRKSKALSELRVIKQGGHSTIVSKKKLKSVQLYNLQGQLIQQLSTTGYQADLHHFDRGVFLLKVHFSNGEIGAKKIYL